DGDETRAPLARGHRERLLRLVDVAVADRDDVAPADGGPLARLPCEDEPRRAAQRLARVGLDAECAADLPGAVVEHGLLVDHEARRPFWRGRRIAKPEPTREVTRAVVGTLDVADDDLADGLFDLGFEVLEPRPCTLPVELAQRLAELPAVVG